MHAGHRPYHEPRQEAWQEPQHRHDHEGGRDVDARMDKIIQAQLQWNRGSEEDEDESLRSRPAVGDRYTQQQRILDERRQQEQYEEQRRVDELREHEELEEARRRQRNETHAMEVDVDRLSKEERERLMEE